MGLLDKVGKFQVARQLMAADLYNYFRVIESAQENTVRYKGKEIIMLGSNNYLGLTNHPRVKEAARAAIAKYGTGCAGSRFLNGTLDIHIELEEKLAALVGKPKALVFSTGFMVNQGVLSSLVQRNESIIVDRTDHASIIDGARLSFADVRKYRHNDMDNLELVLQNERERNKLIVIDGVFSMEGDIARLPEIVTLAEKYDAVVMVDDAHGIGVLGDHGRGTCNHFGLTDRAHLIMGTFSKSLASVGGFIAADEETIHFIQHQARSLIFSASMPPASVASVSAAVDVMLEETWRHEALWRNNDIMRERLQAAGFNTGPSETPIIPAIVGEDMTAFVLCRRLIDEGVFVNPVVSPAVEQGNALIRLSLMATHTEDEINLAMDKMEKVARELGIIPAR
ncbi:MAG: aminotransferase class I/II-fold pyridoxal phosphate-dependent enzyme [bacterium]|jgi:8-amino-7-oxononanoate synthase|nr:aminotransferase class I/II-fold pyridoxal phosphate-dependent enzyme [bacterium]MBK7045251.1 aminotransferase class I/II-fold pyridoxal phosphate-dependent enzyme [bacterium]MBK7187814.1 aminotransferase class I/II-fold pyridoxal phosphate-dependent enzyme [bacterium]MBK7672273.1 aminotransferase class I/II-fold pyridoxal phosphate-dependent enzyme [bacterium]MBK9474103.1 aminotransferase class I/II-fold pyridoxal phosphate-dependent enzyme [bacterium]